MSYPVEHVSICHQVFKRLGGMEHYAILLARALKALGYGVTVYAREADRELTADLGVELVLTAQGAGFRKFRDWHFQRAIDRLVPQMRGVQIGLSRVRVRDISICGGTHLGYLKATRRLHGPFDWLRAYLEKRAYASARLVVSHSDLCSAELCAFYNVPQNRLRTIYPPVDARFCPGNRETSRRCFGLPNETPVFLFPSMGHGRKGLAAVADALAELDEPLVLAVAGKPVNTERYPFLRPLGYVDSMEVAYRAADFTILGSSYEPFGLVGPESVLCGTPLVFDKQIGCIPAIAPAAVTTFDARDKSSIQQAALRALQACKTRTHLLANPRSCLRYNPDPLEHVRSLFDVEPLAHSLP